MLAFLAPFFQLLSGLMGYFRDKKLTDGGGGRSYSSIITDAIA